MGSEIFYTLCDVFDAKQLVCVAELTGLVVREIWSEDAVWRAFSAVVLACSAGLLGRLRRLVSGAPLGGGGGGGGRDGCVVWLLR